jgi:hypothetical protein
VLYLRDLEKVPILKDEMIDDFNYIDDEIDAELIKD